MGTPTRQLFSGLCLDDLALEPLEEEPTDPAPTQEGHGSFESSNGKGQRQGCQTDGTTLDLRRDTRRR